MTISHVPFTFRQLQYFVAVADTGVFRQAAELCHVSQPSLSAQIAHLEEVMGVVLFERDRRGARLTTAGEALLPRARSLLLAARDLADAAEAQGDPFVGELRIGIIPTIAPYLLAEIALAAREQFPALRILWTEDKTPALIESLEGGDLDAALLALEADIGSVDHATIAQDRFVIAAGRDHRLADAGPMSLSELAGERVHLLADGHCFRDQALDLCARVGAQEEVFRATSLATLTQLVANGDAVTLLPHLSLAVENRHGDVVVREIVEPAFRTIALAWRPAYPRAPALQSLAGMIGETYDARVPDGIRRMPG